MTTDLTSGSVSRHLRVQATPMAIGLIAIISFDVVDLFDRLRGGRGLLCVAQRG
jgi:hypothetical protein